LGVLGHTNLAEPIRNLLHRGINRHADLSGFPELRATDFIRQIPGEYTAG
jgi:hypothetical protein